MNIIAYTFDDLLIRCARILDGATIISPRDIATKEVVNANLELKIPCRCMLTNPIRKQNRVYVAKEINWYFSGERSIEKIKPYAKTWQEVADSDGTANSAYGYQIFSQQTPLCISQFEYCVEKIKQDMFTRQAVININQVSHKYDTRDVPCTVSIQIMIRDKKLVTVITMRSSDFIWGLCNDLPFFATLSYWFKNSLCDIYPWLSVGSLFLNLASFHVYKKHFEKVKELSQCTEDHGFHSDCVCEFVNRKCNLENKLKCNCADVTKLTQPVQIKKDIDNDDNIYPLF